MRSVGLVAGFLLLAVASVLARTPYSDPRASAYWFAVLGALVAAAAKVLVARSGLPRIGTSIAAVFGSVLLAKPFLKPSGEYVSATQSFRFYDLTDLHHATFVGGGLLLLGTAFVLFRSQGPSPVFVGPPSPRPANSRVDGRDAPPVAATGGPILYPVLRDMAWSGRPLAVGRPLFNFPETFTHALVSARRDAGSENASGDGAGASPNAFVSYAYDLGTQLATVREGDASELERQAVANLEERSVSWQVTTTHPDGRPRVLAMADEYAAAMLLSPSAMEEAHLLLDTPLLAVAIVNRGSILVQDGRSYEDTLLLLSFCRKEYDAAGSDRICPYPVSVMNNRPSAMIEPATDLPPQMRG